MVRILHFADLHLDRSFAGLSVAPSEAAKRREELRAALRRIVDLAIELNVDALTAGGDLYEHDRAGADTATSSRANSSVSPQGRVFIAPGNHDPYIARQPLLAARVARQRPHLPDDVLGAGRAVGLSDRLGGRAQRPGHSR